MKKAGLKRGQTAEVMEVVIRLAIIMGLLISAFRIVEPFIKPIAIYVFSTHGIASSSAFAIWCGLVSAVDSFIKPVLMGRNVDIPMLVLLVGALGGLLLAGVMGLFLGAVVVALCYQLFMAWLYEQPAEGEEDETSPV